jgi:hypothetical protein
LLGAVGTAEKCQEETSRSKKALESRASDVIVRAARGVVLSLGWQKRLGEFIMLLGGAAAGRSRRFLVA